jgi:hypothetical protein
MGYSTELKLNHNELPAKVNVETGEVKVVNSQRKNNVPEGKEVFEPKALFKKDYGNSWNYLNRVLTPIEYKAAHTLAIMAKANTNSLEPLNDDTTISELMEILNVSKNKVRPILDKLFELGVYGKFEVYNVDKGYSKFWIFNPYLSFSGKIIPSDIVNLFKSTHVAKAFKNPDYK